GVASALLRGAYAFEVFCKSEPYRVIGARVGSGLVVGLKDGVCFLASDAVGLAVAGVCAEFHFLAGGDQVGRAPRGARFVAGDGRA
ncbi:glutamine--fructose-6-phosphate aminotransferase, partial [Burkholderia pseudomallei]